METDKKKFLHDLLAELLGMDRKKVIWSYEGGIRPELPFLLLREYGDGPAAGRTVSRTGTPGVLSVRAPYECHIVLQLFSRRDGDPVETLTALTHRLEAPSVVDRLFADGLAVYEAGDVSDISTVLDDLAYERRAACELSVRYDRMIEDDVGYIDTAEITEKLDDQPERIIRVEVKGEYNGKS